MLFLADNEYKPEKDLKKIIQDEKVKEKDSIFLWISVPLFMFLESAATCKLIIYSRRINVRSERE
jgi:hypothetical protein